MAGKKNVQLGTKKIDTLEVGKVYPVKYSCFRKVNGSRGDFMSGSFIIETEENVQVWVNTPNERSAYKLIGVLTSARLNGHKTSIKSLEVVKNGKYLDFIYDVCEYIPEDEQELDASEFESISAEEPAQLPDIPF